MSYPKSWTEVSEQQNNALNMFKILTYQNTALLKKWKWFPLNSEKHQKCHMSHLRPSNNIKFEVGFFFGAGETWISHLSEIY